MKIKNYDDLMVFLVEILAELGEKLQELEEDDIKNCPNTVLTQADA